MDPSHTDFLTPPKAKKKLSKTCHPDRNPAGEDVFKEHFHRFEALITNYDQLRLLRAQSRVQEPAPSPGPTPWHTASPWSGWSPRSDSPWAPQDAQPPPRSRPQPQRPRPRPTTGPTPTRTATRPAPQVRSTGRPAATTRPEPAPDRWWGFLWLLAVPGIYPGLAGIVLQNVPIHGFDPPGDVHAMYILTPVTVGVVVLLSLIQLARR